MVRGVLGLRAALLSFALFCACRRDGAPGQARPRPSEACAGARPFAWPRGARAAVSLTYDDALPSQLDHAIPALDAAGIPATFFISEGIRFRLHRSRFRSLVARGHELGAHTVEHPCGDELRGYTQDRMRAELLENVATLRELGVASARLTFAYPCGESKLGPRLDESFTPLVRSLFFAARGVVNGTIDPLRESFDETHAIWPTASSTGADIVGAIEGARRTGAWVVVGFHGIGESSEYLPVPHAGHEAIVRYLRDAEGLWVETFGAVSEYVQRCRPGEPARAE